jgi:hypothetical protein
VQGPLKKLLPVGVEVTSTLPNSDTQKDLLMVNAFIQHEHLKTIFHHARGKHKQPFTF